MNGLHFRQDASQEQLYEKNNFHIFQIEHHSEIKIIVFSRKKHQCNLFRMN